MKYGKLVRVYGYKENLGLACLPYNPELAVTMAGTILDVVPKLQMFPVPHFLNITLATSNQCIHPPRMYGLLAGKSTRARFFLFYEQMDYFSAGVIQKVSDETLTIARALEKRASELGYKLDLLTVLPVDEALLKVYEVKDSSSLPMTFLHALVFWH